MKLAATIVTALALAAFATPALACEGMKQKTADKTEARDRVARVEKAAQKADAAKPAARVAQPKAAQN